MENFRVEHKDGNFRYCDGDSCSKIAGTAKLEF